MNNPGLFSPTAENIGSCLGALQCRFTDKQQPFTLETIGESRGGLPLYGVRAGDGPLQITLTAGAHSDEPVGPLACLDLLYKLVADDSKSPWLKKATWRLCPHVNPDGAASNAVWFANPLDIERYAGHVYRELPGDDVEFNYPCLKTGTPSPRPENVAVADFLASDGPTKMHLSLHGMAFAEGAWWLIGSDWVEKTKPLRKRLAQLFDHYELGIHDIERHGEKGFTRIGPRFSTTPTATAMREFFHKQNDEKTARLFLPSSMEYMQSLGGDPLVMVSELPIFRLFGGGVLADPPGDHTPFQRFRPKFAEARKALLKGDNRPLNEVVREFDLRPMPLDKLVEAVVEAVFLSADFVAGLQE